MVFALLSLAAPGCGSAVVESTTEGGGSGGTAGTGGAGAAGGSGGSGGMDEGTCSPEEEAGAFDEPPDLGLSAPPGSPMTAVIVTVTESSLEYTLGPDGGTDTFTWRGPSLTDVFKQGDTVSVGSLEGWHFVAGEQVAATYTEYAFVPPGTLPPVPMSKAPPLGYATQCFFPENAGACGQPPSDVSVLFLRAGTGTDTIDVPVGATVEAGGFQLHNAQSVALPGYGSDDCVLEALFMTGVTVLGPIGK